MKFRIEPRAKGKGRRQKCSVLSAQCLVQTAACHRFGLRTEHSALSPVIGSLLLTPGVLLAQLPMQQGGPPPLPYPDILPPVPVELSWPLWLVLLACAAALGVVLLFLWLFMGKKAPQGLPVKRPLKEALHAMKALRAKAELLPPSQIGHEVSEVLRRYYLERYGIPAPFKTTEELFPAGSAEQEPPRRRMWRERFESLAALYDSLSYAPMPATKDEALALVETAIMKLEEERLHENPLAD